ncbi:MAG: zinc-dependent metalloprotease [Phaeodactylibacter sp.]|uniref:zinc-dependent metalloprotease n=1 Tax=Phaeodactylibacter sp. TaxID=1940289 RepID=UPI0032F08152
MARLLFTIVLALSFAGIAVAQSNWDHPCGTPAGKSAWLKAYQRNPQAFQRDNDTTLYVPLTIHIVGTDSGAGFFALSGLKAAFCKLNESFQEANIQFFMAGEINYLMNSAWYSHETVLEGAEMMFANNVDGTLNIYFVNDPAGNCGYNLPYAGIAMRKSCSGPNDNTWAHEIGHALAIPHPFLGWEGGVSYDGSVTHNYNNPAPETITYDYTFFQDTLIEDTLIIDTAYVELTDGSNCTFAADGFCDTAPDYLAQRWFCDVNGESPTIQTDPTGATFRSDGSLIMGYSDDACQARFTGEQIAAMRADLYDENPDWISDAPPLEPVAGPVTTFLFPVEGAELPFDEVLFSWSPVANASHYILQVSPLPTFGIRSEYVVEGTELLVTDLVGNRTYYWRITPFNSYSFCAPVVDGGTFNTSEVSSVQSLGPLTAFRAYPQPVGAGQDLTVDFTAQAPLKGSLSLYSSLGQPLWEASLDRSPGRHTLSIPTAQWPAGLYFLTVRTTSGQAVQQVIIE